MRVDLTIDELILVDFSARDRHRIAEALERDLRDALTPVVVRQLIGRLPTRVTHPGGPVPAAVDAPSQTDGVPAIAASIIDAASRAHARQGGR